MGARVGCRLITSSRCGSGRHGIPWWRVPPSLQKALGKRIKGTLKTRDVHVARARRWKVVAEIKAEIASGQKRKQGDPLMQEALAFREVLADPEKLDGGHFDEVDGDDTEAVVRVQETAPNVTVAAESQNGEAPAKRRSLQRRHSSAPGAKQHLAHRIGGPCTTARSAYSSFG